MRYVIVPINVAAIVLGGNLQYARLSVDGTKVLVHEEILLKWRETQGFSVLPSEDTGTFEWTYPVYLHGSSELNSLLNSEE